jgi:hypothetical protein
MDADSDRVVVTVAAGSGATQVHHRDFPEIRAEGATPSAAAGHLANQLTRALDSALTKWRRESIQQAIADVREFADRST